VSAEGSRHVPRRRTKYFWIYERMQLCRKRPHAGILTKLCKLSALKPRSSFEAHRRSTCRLGPTYVPYKPTSWERQQAAWSSKPCCERLTQRQRVVSPPTRPLFLYLDNQGNPAQDTKFIYDRLRSMTRLPPFPACLCWFKTDLTPHIPSLISPYTVRMRF